jgi:hypothetical protein
MSAFLPENPGVIKMDRIAEIRRLHFVKNEAVSALAKTFNLSSPTIRKQLRTVEEPVYPTRQHPPRPKLGTYLDQLQTWLENDATLPVKRRRTAQCLYKCLQVEG